MHFLTIFENKNLSTQSSGVILRLMHGTEKKIGPNQNFSAFQGLQIEYF